MCLDVLIWNASLLREIVFVQRHHYAERKPKSLLREKIEKSMVCFVLTFTVFHVVLSARSAVLLYSLGSNLLFLVSSGKKKMVLPCQTLSLCQQTVNLACDEDLTITLPGYCLS